MHRWGRLPRWARVIAGAYVAAFLFATVSHLVDIAVYRDDVYSSAPVELRLFFVALTFIDPIVVCLNLFLRRTGISLAALVMVADVWANWSMTSLDATWPPPITLSIFGAFVLATALPYSRAIGRLRLPGEH